VRKSGTPTELWCYVTEWAARTMSLTVHNLPALKLQSLEEVLLGHTPDISEFAHHFFFEWIWYHDSNSFPEPRLCLGRWIGVASDVGQPMTYWILTENCMVIAHSSVKLLQLYEMADPVIIQKQEAIMHYVHATKKWSEVFNNPWIIEDDKEPIHDFDLEWEQEVYVTPEADTFTPETYVEYLSAQVTLPIGGFAKAKS